MLHSNVPYSFLLLNSDFPMGGDAQYFIYFITKEKKKKKFVFARGEWRQKEAKYDIKLGNKC